MAKIHDYETATAENPYPMILGLLDGNLSRAVFTLVKTRLLLLLCSPLGSALF